MNRGQVAAKVAANKAKHPEDYCPTPNCLWNTKRIGGGPCPRHGGAKLSTMQQITFRQAGEMTQRLQIVTPMQITGINDVLFDKPVTMNEGDTLELVHIPVEKK